MNPKTFLTKIIRIRKRLVKVEKSYKNAVTVLNDIDFFEKHLAANHYTDKQMAAFFVRHADRIQYLIPGCGCASNSRLNNEYTQVLNYCKNLL